MRRSVFTVAWLVSLTAAAAAQQVILDDSLRGSSGGVVSGGAFQADGWRVTGKNDFIYWHIPTVSDGAVEFSVRGLRPNQHCGRLREVPHKGFSAISLHRKRIALRANDTSKSFTSP